MNWSEDWNVSRYASFQSIPSPPRDVSLDASYKSPDFMRRRGRAPELFGARLLIPS
jgi:hypothetical protein